MICAKLGVAQSMGAVGTSADNASGMMSQQQIAQLEGLRDGDFDTAWLKMMIEHHSGAIATAQSELSDGDNADAKQLAPDIIAAQQSEITAMQALLQQN